MEEDRQTLTLNPVCDSHLSFRCTRNLRDASPSGRLVMNLLRHPGGDVIGASIDTVPRIVRLLPYHPSIRRCRRRTEVQFVHHALYEGVDSGEWTVSTFEDTPLMSTYLLAFANGAFEHRESSYTSPISGKTRPLRVYGIQFLADRFVTLVPDIDVQRRRISSDTLNSCSTLPLAPFRSSRKCLMWSTPCPSSTHLSRMISTSAQWRTGYALRRVDSPEERY